ncbi:MAG: hypothetical protein HN416_16135, partial [Nitrospina sp.]|nr:hypothetical protein [Nitrospina sp.]
MKNVPDGVPERLIVRLLDSPRIIRPGLVLEDFLEKGVTRTRVIVNLRETETS